MRWYDKKLVGASTLALALGGCGVFGGRHAEARLDDRSVRSNPGTLAQADEIPSLGDPYTIAGQKFEPKDDMNFDEVGYGVVGGQSPDIGAGEGYNPASMSGAHRILPVPSYVEVTHLDTGKTILVRINSRGPMLKDRIIALSEAAARELGLDGAGSAPLRVRRVNPPMPEKAMLRSGSAAPARLDTPPSLLSALRRKLNESGLAKPRGLAEVPAAPVAAVAKPWQKAKPAPRIVAAPGNRPGATFDVPAPGARPVTQTVSRPAPMAQSEETMDAPAPRKGGDRFVVEDAQGRTLVTTTGAVNVVRDDGQPVESSSEEETSSVSTRSNANYYVQIASFGDAARAKALARVAGGGIERAGNLYRVRTGPYDDAGSADAALSQARSKGYRDARISR
jgi:rare lipoprotein A